MVLNIKKQSNGLYTVDVLRFESLASARDYATCMSKAKGCEYFMSPECREEWEKGPCNVDGA
ncbi:hypothetical protein [Dethiosulfovibrio salsuginis]|uniref:Uncharacterized protein n=1 Tax=Dethiosulfovibrio salsuginis TaxID=561720 RepID=A0A1X7KHW2_9BACT|nr:hypothetical protein [Dethiosulfovibrio salsuginis]SMG40964.1 hypothetical protein SAMN06275492_12843 [Dethiosulfovibrio salsuginis]